MGPKDSPKEIALFMKSMSLGRANYVSYSSSLGYKSINYQDPDTGNTALHLAVKNGHPQAVEELLKVTLTLFTLTLIIFDYIPYIPS